MEDVGTSATLGSGGGSLQTGDTTSPAPQFGRHAVGLMLCFHERSVIVGRMDIDCVAKAFVADQIQSIIHFWTPRPG